MLYFEKPENVSAMFSHLQAYSILLFHQINANVEMYQSYNCLLYCGVSSWFSHSVRLFMLRLKLIANLA